MSVHALLDSHLIGTPALPYRGRTSRRSRFSAVHHWLTSLPGPFPTAYFVLLKMASTEDLEQSLRSETDHESEREIIKWVAHAQASAPTHRHCPTLLRCIWPVDGQPCVDASTALRGWPGL